jgi:DNA modification methylase
MRCATGALPGYLVRMREKPPLVLATTTLWEYPSQHYGNAMQGDKDYAGATPSWVVWNLLRRYTRPKDLVVDPMCGSGTTIDVARDLSRRALGYDIAPSRPDIFRADARRLPLEDGKADFVFIDPPYSDHLQYSDDPACIGRLSALEPGYYKAMETVIGEIDRILRPGRFMALYTSDSYETGKPFMPIGLELFVLLRRHFEAVDHIAVVRKNAKLLRNHWHTAAAGQNYYLRGFNHLFIMYKPAVAGERPVERRLPEDIAQEIAARTPVRDATGKNAASGAGPSVSRGRTPGGGGGYSARRKRPSPG